MVAHERTNPDLRAALERRRAARAAADRRLPGDFLAPVGSYAYSAWHPQRAGR